MRRRVPWFFVRDPSIVRHARAEEPDTSVLAVGGPRGTGYEPSPWEDAEMAAYDDLASLRERADWPLSSA